VNILQAAVLGVVEGLTEFLPVSSTGHLTITEKLLGLKVDDPGITAFTAVIQVGATVAVVVFFRRDIARLAVAWFRGLRVPQARREFDYRFAWYVIAGSVPIGVVGLLARDLVSGPLRNLWVVAAALVGWSAVMIWAERAGRQDRGELDLRLRDVMVVGLVQCLALVPGVSRSGATISAGLLRGIDRVTATRLSFFLSIPALTAAGALEAVGRQAQSPPRSDGRPPSSERSSASSSRTRRSLGCCGWSPTIPSPCSSATGSHWAPPSSSRSAPSCWQPPSDFRTAEARTAESGPLHGQVTVVLRRRVRATSLKHQAGRCRAPARLIRAAGSWSALVGA
jgi:undecaprenyl-diphosphatase